jgi:hypothetical protein
MSSQFRFGNVSPHLFHSEQLESQFLFYQYMQNNFDYTLCREIFHDYDHMYNKWLASNGNIITYISLMDCSNREKFLLYFVEFVVQNIVDNTP